MIIVVAVLAIRAVTGGDTGTTGGGPGGQPSQDVCPPRVLQAPRRAHVIRPTAAFTAGRSPTRARSPWGPPQGENRVPFGSDVQSQIVPVETNYDGSGSNWVASILVGELQAGDGFFTPEQGSQIVVKCILGKFYGDNPVNSNVKVNEKTTIDGHEAWLVESQLTFDIAGLKTKGELLIVAIVSAGNRSGLYYASIPDTTPELVQPARRRPEEPASRRLAPEDRSLTCALSLSKGANRRISTSSALICAAQPSYAPEPVEGRTRRASTVREAATLFHRNDACCAFIDPLWRSRDRRMPRP